MELPLPIFHSAFKSLILGFVLTGCGLTLTAQPDGKAIYAQYCAACHGVNLEGGQSGGFLDARPNPEAAE